MRAAAKHTSPWARSTRTPPRRAARVARRAVEAAGGSDILVNNAGTYPMADWWRSRPEEWIESYNLDVVSCVRLIQALVPAMVERGWGRVINVSSASAVRSPANFFPIYSASKAAQPSLAGHLAVELAGTGVTVNTCSPGPVSSRNNVDFLTRQTAEAGRPTEWASVERDYVDTLMQDPPSGRMTRPDEVPPVIAYLASPLSDAGTGANFVIDGGYALTGFKRQASSLGTRPGARAAAE